MHAERVELLDEAARQMAEAADAAKCWPCGCLHGTLTALDAAPQDLPAEAKPFREVLASATHSGGISAKGLWASS